jgi:hypothetical protein
MKMKIKSLLFKGVVFDVVLLDETNNSFLFKIINHKKHNNKHLFYHKSELNKTFLITN